MMPSFSPIDEIRHSHPQTTHIELPGSDNAVSGICQSPPSVRVHPRQTLEAEIAELIRQTYLGALIEQRVGDGYVNGTAMCKARGKLLGHYLENAATKSFSAHPLQCPERSEGNLGPSAGDDSPRRVGNLAPADIPA